ncbi:hypothetical protein B0G81_3876 [Paraburkholderia sp. BL6665CI2N2]|nr:hypothetical protein B0G81_3876 [Paraburkholderia sp. BL6665CI2N2]
MAPASPAGSVTNRISAPCPQSIGSERCVYLKTLHIPRSPIDANLRSGRMTPAQHALAFGSPDSLSTIENETTRIEMIWDASPPRLPSLTKPLG